MSLKPKQYRLRFISAKRPFFWAVLVITSIFVLAGLVQADGENDVPDVGAPPTTAVAPDNNLAADADDSTAPQMTGHLNFLPMIVKAPTLATGCGLNAQEMAVADLATNHPNQGRINMTCDTILAQVAREKAMDMATRGYFSHVDPDGHGPNWHVRTAGYNLPSWYGSTPDANNIESIAAGYPTAEAAWDAWLSSAGHRVHVLAESSFWADQTRYGIGYYYDANSPYHHYWVFMSAPPE